jgi:hypothetical protein
VKTEPEPHRHTPPMNILRDILALEGQMLTILEKHNQLMCDMQNQALAYNSFMRSLRTLRDSVLGDNLH